MQSDSFIHILHGSIIYKPRHALGNLVQWAIKDKYPIICLFSHPNISILTYICRFQGPLTSGVHIHMCAHMFVCAAYKSYVLHER
jgi:hypothetical protein